MNTYWKAWRYRAQKEASLDAQWAAASGSRRHPATAHPQQRLPCRAPHTRACHHTLMGTAGEPSAVGSTPVMPWRCTTPRRRISSTAAATMPSMLNT